MYESENAKNVSFTLKIIKTIVDENQKNKEVLKASKKVIKYLKESIAGSVPTPINQVELDERYQLIKASQILGLIPLMSRDEDLAASSNMLLTIVNEKKELLGKERK